MGLRTPVGASRGGSFFVGRDVSAWDGVHTYSCVRYATLPSVCTDYARSVSQADETGFYAPSVAHNALPRRPWRCISVVLSIILQTLSSFAMRSHKSMCACCPRRLRSLRCGKMCGRRVRTGGRCLRPATYRYLYFLWESEVCGRGVGYTVSGERIAKLSRYC